MSRLVDLYHDMYEARGSARTFTWERDASQKNRIRQAEKALDDAIVSAPSPEVMWSISNLTEQVVRDLGGCDYEDHMRGAVSDAVYSMYFEAVRAEHERRLQELTRRSRGER